MPFFKSVFLRLRALVRPRSVEADLDDEIQFHLEQETRKNQEAGMKPDEARRAARIAFGNVEATKEDHRDARGVRLLQDLSSDARFAARTFRRRPALAVAAIITLALGIGANTAIFSAVNAVILRPLPFPDSDRLVMLFETNPEFQWTEAAAAPANVLDWKERVDAFADVASYNDFGGSTTLTGYGSPRLLKSVEVTGNFFDVLNVRPIEGRLFREAETWQTGSPVAVISERLWRSLFEGDPSAAGRTVLLDGESVQIIGVVPAWMDYPFEGLDVWRPTAWDPADRTQVWFRRAHWTRPIARLKPDVSLQAADAQFQTVVTQLQTEFPETNRIMGAGMAPLHDFLVRDTRQPLMLLLATVGLLLLLAAANVGNLMLVLAAGRERESAMRLALGAGPGRLIRQALTESLLLSLVGGSLGLAVGWWGTRALVVLQPPGILPVSQIPVDWTVLGYVLLASVLSGILFGLAPIVRQRHRHPIESLREGGRGGQDGSRKYRWEHLLVTAEVAIALLLTVGAGLLTRSFLALTQVDPGFAAEGVLAVRLNASGPKYRTAQDVIGFYDDVVRRVEALPGVSSAAVTSELPLTSWGWTSQFAVAGRDREAYGNEVAHREVTPGYFETMGVPILQGRDISTLDGRGAPLVVLINESLAKEYFPGENPIGQRVTFERYPDSTSAWRTIIGIVQDERQSSLAAKPKIQFIAPYAQAPRTAMELVARTSVRPEALGAEIRRAIAAIDPDLAIVAMRTMREVRSTSLARERFLMMMLMAFAGTGLFLAIVGVYGVMAQFARTRVREMGIRIALGARASQVRWMVLRRGLALVVTGLAVGGVAARLTTGGMQNLLYGVTPSDPPTYLLVAATLLGTATIAILLPAVRASRADPTTALRDE